MKKVLVILLSVVMMLCFCSCDNNNLDTSSTSDAVTSDSTTVDASNSLVSQNFNSCTFNLDAVKKSYLLNEDFSSAGATASAVTKSGVTLNLKAANLIFDTAAYNKAVAGTYTIKVSMDIFVETFEVTVYTPTGCTFNFDNVTKVYTLGQTVDTKGIVATATAGNFSAVVDNALLTVDSSNYKNNEAGVYQIKVSCYGFEGTFDAEVCSPSAVVFDVSNVNKLYLLNETFSAKGAKLTATIKTNLQIELDETFMQINSSSFNATATGSYNITLSYLSFTKTYKVVVASAPIAEGNIVNFKVDDSISESDFGTTDSTGALLLDTPKNALRIIESAQYEPTVIKKVQIAPGTYTEKYTINAQNVQYIGTNAETTILTYGDCSSMAGGTDASTSIYIKGSNFFAKGITFENSFDYTDEVTYKKYGDKQAVAVTIQADKTVFDDCIFLGYQDTLQVKNGRHYFNNCTIKGCVDFIFGNNPTIVFDKCEIVTLNRSNVAGTNNNCMTAMKGNLDVNDQNTTDYGLIFWECNLTAEEGVAESSVALGRPWRKNATVAYIKCAMGKHIAKNLVNAGNSRYQSMSGGGATNQPVDAKFYEYLNTGDGALSEATADFTMLDATTFANYTLANIFGATNGLVTYADAWNVTATLTSLGVVSSSTIA